MNGFAMLVLIAEIATMVPKKYEPPSPRKTFAFGKLNKIKNPNTIIIKNKKQAKLLLPLIKLIKNKLVRIINE